MEEVSSTGAADEVICKPCTLPLSPYSTRSRLRVYAKRLLWKIPDPLYPKQNFSTTGVRHN